MFVLSFSGINDSFLVFSVSEVRIVLSVVLNLRAAHLALAKALPMLPQTTTPEVSRLGVASWVTSGKIGSDSEKEEIPKTK